jgi:hypothetical protein
MGKYKEEEGENGFKNKKQEIKQHGYIHRLHSFMLQKGITPLHIDCFLITGLKGKGSLDLIRMGKKIFESKLEFKSEGGRPRVDGRKMKRMIYKSWKRKSGGKMRIRDKMAHLQYRRPRCLEDRK